MTARREWPNAAKHNRDRAAEELEIVIRKMVRLAKRIDEGKYTRAGLERDVLQMQTRLQTAARHLQAAGAPIEPE